MKVRDVVLTIVLAVFIWPVIQAKHPKAEPPVIPLKKNDRVVVVDRRHELVAYVEGGDALSAMFGKGTIMEKPESERALNGEKGVVIDVGCEQEIPQIHYYTDGTQKITGYSCIGKPAYTVQLDNGKVVKMLRRGLKPDEVSSNSEEPNFIVINGKVVPNPKKRH